MKPAIARGEVIAETAPMKSMLNSAWHTARWLETAALGWAVAPEVNRISAGSVGAGAFLLLLKHHQDDPEMS